LPITTSSNSAIPSATSPPRSTPPPSSSKITSNYGLRSKGFPPSSEAYLASFEAMISTFFMDIPDQYKDAMSSPERELWKVAIQEEYNSLINNNTWSLVTPPPDANIVESTLSIVILCPGTFKCACAQKE